MKDHERSWRFLFGDSRDHVRNGVNSSSHFEPIQIQSLPPSGLMKPLGCFTNIFVANECCLGWYPLTNQPGLMKSYECTHWIPDCKSHLAFGHRNFSSCMSQRDGSPESEATISQPPAQMTGGYITYQIIKCQYHIAWLGTNIWKVNKYQISFIYSNIIKYQILFITEKVHKSRQGTQKKGRNLQKRTHRISGLWKDLWTRGTHRDCYAEMRWFLRCKKNNTRTHFFLHVFYVCFNYPCVWPKNTGSERYPRICADRPRPPGATVQSWGAKGHQPFIQKKRVWQQQPAEHQDWEFIDLSDLSADYEYKSIYIMH